MLRAAPPARVDANRRPTFVAALEQFEELIRASRVVAPAAQPLPLFYALSQAGRAIGAARLENDWQLHGHGLSIPRSRRSHCSNARCAPGRRPTPVTRFTASLRHASRRHSVETCRSGLCGRCFRSSLILAYRIGHGQLRCGSSQTPCRRISPSRSLLLSLMQPCSASPKTRQPTRCATT